MLTMAEAWSAQLNGEPGVPNAWQIPPLSSDRLRFGDPPCPDEWPGKSSTTGDSKLRLKLQTWGLPWEANPVGMVESIYPTYAAIVAERLIIELTKQQGTRPRLMACN